MRSAVGIVLLAIVVGSGIGAGAEAGLKVDVIVADYLEPLIANAMDQYLDDLVALGNTPTLTIWGKGDAWALRDYLRERWLAGELDGATLIGELPTAWFESEWRQRRGDPAWNGVPFYRAAAQFPTDHFLTDLDGEWIDSDNNGVFDIHRDGTGDVTPEIWVGRIWTSTLGHESTIVRKYLERVHRWKWGQLDFRNEALCYVDDDWSGYWATEYSADVQKGFENVVKVDDPWTTWRDDWLSRITEPGGWTWAHLCSHSWPQGHAFKRGEDWSYVYSTEIPYINPQVGFFNFFDCSFARFTEQDYGAGAYVFRSSYGLGGVGSTKTGGMYYAAPFYETFRRGGCLGEAFKNWWTAMGADGYDAGEIDWWYGMVVVGDPTLQPIRDTIPYSSPAGLLQQGWNWLSVPAEPANPSVESIMAGEDPTNRLYQWDPIAKTIELYPDDFGRMEVGRGYTLLVADAQSMQFLGRPTGKREIVPLPIAGWTWIGHPFEETMPLVDLTLWGPGGGSPILEDGFGDGDADGWDAVSGAWQVEQARYLQTLNTVLLDSKAVAWPDLEDFRVEATLRILHNQGDAGVVVRGSGFGSGMYASYGYYVGLDPDLNRVIVGKLSNGWTTLAAFPLAIDTDRDYVLAVSAEGSRFGVFVDGVKLGEFSDAEFTHGQVALRTNSVDCEFDDIVVGADHTSRTALEDAQAPDAWLNWNLLYWDTTQRTVKIVSPRGGDDDTMRPWRGYRVWSNVDDLALVFTRP